MKLWLATTNQHKKREWERLCRGSLSFEIFDSKEKAPEPYLSFVQNAKAKVLFYLQRVKGLVLAEDSGLWVEGLGGFPGVFSSRVLAEEGYAEKNVRLLSLLASRPHCSRRCCYRLALCLFSPGPLEPSENWECEPHEEGYFFFHQAVAWGEVAEQPAGEHGFGYDPIFFLPSHQKTFAEMSEEEKDRVSHRGKAARHLCQLLQRNHPSFSQSPPSIHAHDL